MVRRSSSRSGFPISNRIHRIQDRPQLAHGLGMRASSSNLWNAGPIPDDSRQLHSPTAPAPRRERVDIRLPLLDRHASHPKKYVTCALPSPPVLVTIFRDMKATVAALDNAALDGPKRQSALSQTPGRFSVWGPDGQGLSRANQPANVVLRLWTLRDTRKQSLWHSRRRGGYTSQANA